MKNELLNGYLEAISFTEESYGEENVEAILEDMEAHEKACDALEEYLSKILEDHPPEIDDEDCPIEAIGVKGRRTITLSQIGIDLWFTRNGHGVGFWDGNYEEPYATLLTEFSEKMGEYY